MNITIVEEKISLNELREIAKEFYGTMIKGVVDIEKHIVVFGGEFHMDANNKLLEGQNSLQKNVWGFNVHLDKPRETWIEFTSLINIRPLQNNFDIEITDVNLRQKMKVIINTKIQ
ncbi:MAG: DUF5674 family protein [Patescibacteria group bacterium]